MWLDWKDRSLLFMSPSREATLFVFFFWRRVERRSLSVALALWSLTLSDSNATRFWVEPFLLKQEFQLQARDGVPSPEMLSSALKRASPEKQTNQQETDRFRANTIDRLTSCANRILFRFCLCVQLWVSNAGFSSLPFSASLRFKAWRASTSRKRRSCGCFPRETVGGSICCAGLKVDRETGLTRLTVFFCFFFIYI